MKRFIYILSFALLFLLSRGTAQENNQSPKVKISGLMFGDYYYNIDNIDSTQKNINGFQFRRIYFTTDFTIADNFDSRFRLESDQSSNSNTAGGKLGVMIKDAYLKWKEIFSGSDLLFGISPTPAFDISEAAWSYRSLEKTILDLNGIVSSRDFGLDFKGKIFNDGSINYWVKVANNSGNAPEIDKYKRYYALIHVKPIDGFQATIYGDYAAKADKKDSFDKQTKSNNAFIGALFLNYQQKNYFAIGLETFARSIQNNFAANATTALQDQKSFGLSFWAWAALMENIRFVARLDDYDPNTDNDNDATILIIAGLDYRPAKNVSLIPNVWLSKIQGKDSKNLIGRLTFAYTF